MDDGAAAHPPTTRTKLVRVVGFVLLAIHLQAGSLAEQVLHVRRPVTTMSWQMYSGKGKKICATTWYTADPDGALTPVDRLGAGDRQKRRLKNVQEVEDAARRLCTLLGPGADVRVRARCGTRSGRWKQAIRPDQPLCAARAQPRLGP